ncbi:serine hydrolase [uncultured Tenacibaculum sp.]|uniref:serine hydrolase domain-containing protein n=1 Tax=uncultured Tenacibaculum sp. TaxID=174713 RepID=UPI00260DCC19|nr:serine hydrolase domain-containing protein [uncultured Tenacibaculum sp.]
MKKTLIVIFVLLIISCKEKNISKISSAEKKEQVKDSLTTELNKIYKKGFMNGFSMAIVDKNGTLYNKGFGYADIKTKKPYTEHTIQNVASISKIVVGLALLKAQEMGFLELDDPINNHLPFNVSNPNYPEIPITIRQLVSHTSSINDTDFYWSKCYVLIDSLPDEDKKIMAVPDNFNPKENWLPLSEFLEKLLSKNGEWYNKEIFTDKEPNSTNQYSNIGSALCALIIESASKTPFNEFSKQHIFNKLGMNSSGWFFNEINRNNFTKLYSEKKEIPHYIGLTYPDGHLITSTNDLALLLSEIIKGFDGKGELLTKNGYKEFYKSQLTKEQVEKGDEDNLGIFIEKLNSNNVYGHSGQDPGVFTLMFFDPNKKIGRILIKNTESEKDEAHKAFWSVWNKMEEFQDKLR